MPIPLYMDENVHRAITLGLRLRQVDVLTAQEDGRASFPDPELLDRATELQRLMFSQDTDLLAEAQLRQEQGIEFPGVVYAHQRNVSIGQCVRDLELIGWAGNPEDFKNRVQHLPL